MAIVGAHVLLYTTEPEALRATLRDVFGWKHVDAGDGWLIFALPPAEIGVHPAEGPTYAGGTRHQLTLMCDDLAATLAELRAKGVEATGEPEDEGFGITVMLRLPGGVEVMLYEPRHASPLDAVGTGGALAGDEAEIRALVDARARAVQARDVAQATSRHAPDLVLFDVLPPLRYVGVETARERTEAWFSTFDGTIDYEVRDLVVTAGPTVAFCHYLYRVRGTLEAGPRIDMWVRATLGFSKIDGTWRLTHEHDSVPFDAESGKALLDLQP